MFDFQVRSETDFKQDLSSCNDADGMLARQDCVKDNVLGGTDNQLFPGQTLAVKNSPHRVRNGIWQGLKVIVPPGTELRRPCYSNGCGCWGDTLARV
jgi:hypothetical protein